jgi:antitoxin VapB
MVMVTSTVFRNNTTQAVRLPRAVALPEGVKRVEIRVVGNARVIEPVGSAWASWFDDGPRVGEDFLPERDQGAADPRDWW